MATLEENIKKAIADFDDIEAAIEEQGVEVADGTDTSEYGNLIRGISGGGDSPIQYVESPDENGNTVFLRSLESGTYVLKGTFKPYDGNNTVCRFSSNLLVNVVKGTLNKVPTSHIQIFYPVHNVVQFVEVTDSSYKRTDIKLNDLAKMETVESVYSKVFENKNLLNGEGIELIEGYARYSGGGKVASEYYNYFSNITLKAGVEYTFYPKVRFIHDNANDVDIYGGKDTTPYTYTPTEDVVVNVTVFKEDMETIKLFESQYQPSVVERYGFNQLNSNILNAPIKYIESLDENNILSLRDLDTGYYLLHGYFHPYPNSNSTLVMDTIIALVAKITAGSHILTIAPLNFKFNLHEVLVDDTVEDGFTYDSKSIRMWDFENTVQELIERIQTLEENGGGGMTPDGGEVILPSIDLDSTLTQEGMAADAKAVGDRFKTQAENEEPIYGEELASANGWTSDGWTGDFANGFTHTTGNTTPLVFTMPEETAQNTYRISFRCSESIAVESLMVKCGGSELFDLFGQNAEPLTVGIVSVENGNVEFVPMGTFTGTITDISIKRVTGVIPTGQTITDSTGKTSFEIRTTKAKQNNIFLGNNAGENNVSGYGCVALGSGALNKNTSGFWNIGVGYNTLRSNTVGSRNVGVGYTALGNNITGSRNIALGSFALNRNTTGNKNIAIGADSIDHNVSGSENVGIGYSALYNNTTGNSNLAIGSQAITSNTTGTYNVAVGAEALYGNTTGNYNVAVGAKTLNKNEGANYSVAIGYTALYGCKGGVGNTAVGMAAGKGTNNGMFRYGVFIGYNTGAKSTTGADYNICIGYTAGDNITTGANNICIGKNARTPTETTSNYLNIGDLIVGSMANADKHAKINGGLQLSDIPTSDPAIAGRVWNDNGTLKVSAG